ncbi:MAG: TetR/AcrR family transcriptional regulator [Planctomycetota bacterium]|nr:TetR/AcrR family transcriptional regulator [Planctomycetota bacterium]
MQTPNKQDLILDAAAELFATKEFHEVRLEDVAARAHVGKGTLYLYWSSKEDVYLAVIRRGFAAVNERIDHDLGVCGPDCWAQIRVILDAVIDFAFRHPGVYRIMRSGPLTPEDPELQRTRRVLSERIEACLRSGVKGGQICDADPRLTAQYVLSFVRGAMLYPPPDLTREALSEHMFSLLRRGIGSEGRR